MIKRSKNNRKVFYAYVTKKNSKKCANKIGPLIDKDKHTVVCDKDIAVKLNQNFASVFSKKHSNLEGDGQDVVDSNNSSRNLFINNVIISDALVVKTMGEFKAHKSPGIDGITSTYALKIKDLVAFPLSILFNRLIEESVVPSDWKRANITPIFKKGDRSICLFVCLCLTACQHKKA